MAKFVVTYTETLERSYIVDAEDWIDAKEIIYDAVSDCEIILDADDYCDFDICVRNATDNDTEIYCAYVPEG